MENLPIPPKKVSLNYGIILGIILILISVIIYALDKHYDQDWVTRSPGIIAMFVIIFLGIKKYREFNNGFLKMGQALKTGIGIALIGAIISLIYTFIFLNYIEPDYMDKMMEIQEQTLIERFPDFTDEQIETQLAMVEKFSSPAVTTAFVLIVSLFFGFIISLISGAILKKSDEEVTSI
jgi:hypothetical protein